MDLDLKINEFEGPLDLLLHLIKENKMDIFDIEIEKITEQYLAYLDSQESMNLEIASEYLVLATELIEIKSKMLLPNEKEKIEKEEEIDPREELVNRLLEYEAYKKITQELKEKESIRRAIYTKPASNLTEYRQEDSNIGLDNDINDLVEALKRFIERKKEDAPISTKVTENEITVSSRRYDIKMILLREKKVSFYKLFPTLTKEYIVATFLAILEMAKSRELMITQNNTFDDIVCEVVENG